MKTNSWIGWMGWMLSATMMVGCGASDGGDAYSMASESAGDSAAGGAAEDDPVEEPEFEPGQLTAGEWSDLENWDYWLELLDTDTSGFAAARDRWNLHADDRVVIRVMHDDSPVSDAKVRLVDDAMSEVWDTRTDMNGYANLFIDAVPNLPAPTTIRINRDNETVVMPLPRVTDPREPIIVQLDEDHDTPDTVDVAFVVDTTGSMGDELRYIQSELADVISRAEGEVEGVDFRVAAAVYRDKQDAYTSRGADFDDAAKIATFLGKQSADGGGDFPEAVEAGLAEALDFEWSRNARTRLLFLVLDAPPHDDRLDEIRAATRNAAERGIRIIPVAASGVDKPTEQLLRSMAIVTGGTYTFLTDHSGIGNEHLEPTVGKFEVEKLNELLLRILLERSNK